jgi:hypothetical protein
VQTVWQSRGDDARRRFHRGDNIVDLWGGVRNKVTASPGSDTMVVIHSATKGLAAMTLAHAYSVFATGGQELRLRQETLDLLAAPAVPPTRGFYDECLKGEVQFSPSGTPSHS